MKEQAYDERSDLWSLGCLMYELCALAPPFPAPNQQVLGVRVREGRFRRIPQHYSAELHTTIASLLKTQVRREEYAVRVINTELLKSFGWEWWGWGALFCSLGEHVPTV